MTDTTNTVGSFSARAQVYDQYRWPFDEKIVSRILGRLHRPEQAVCADIGSGTGMLAHLFVDKVSSIYCIEPSEEMRRLAVSRLNAFPAFIDISGFSNDTGLADACVDVILVGRALHWFDIQSSKREFKRISRAPHWLAIVRTPCTDTELMSSLDALSTQNVGVDLAQKTRRIADVENKYFTGTGYETFAFPGVVVETWEEFFNRISSFSYAPRPGSVLYPRFREALLGIFKSRSQEGKIIIPMKTEVLLGKLS
ncbi:MAG: methyltransferase domain-containing protein [Granulosicoccus sp.]|nr:methyltransferase domain-containing protein [Granulosicoccus sp.]